MPNERVINENRLKGPSCDVDSCFDPSKIPNTESIGKGLIPSRDLKEVSPFC